MRGFPLGPRIQNCRVDDDLTGGIELQAGPVHRPRRRPFKVDALAVVAAAVAGALELVLSRFPVGRATQVRTARVDYEEALRVADHPDAVLLLEFRLDAESKIGWVADLENRGGL